MSAPFASDSLEDQLARAVALLRVVELVFSHRDDESLDDEAMAGAEICLDQVLDVLDRIQVGLPFAALNAKISEKQISDKSAHRAAKGGAR